MNKIRLDQHLVNNGYFESREKAQANIVAGNVYVNSMISCKPSTAINTDDIIEIKSTKDAYSSRGGNKLEKAFEEFDLDVNGLCGADIGASTGGFTDCLLKHGALKVYAVDVGYGQLDYRLRMDNRVRVLERTNARYLKPESFDEKPEFATIDVSFISIQKIIPALSTCLADNAFIIALVKPQFEAGRAQVGKNGVVRDEAVHTKVLSEVCACFIDYAYKILKMTYSPLQGPKGNIEFLLYAARGTGHKSLANLSMTIKETVEKAHANF